MTSIDSIFFKGAIFQGIAHYRYSEGSELFLVARSDKVLLVYDIENEFLVDSKSTDLVFGGVMRYIEGS